MTDVDRLFAAFLAARRDGDDADVRSYLAQVRGRDREELGVLIEGHLERAPRRRWNAEAFAGSSAERVVTALAAPGGSWPELLPELRDEAQLPRDELARRLAASLGVEERADKVHRYYHEMEHGRLPARGVSQRVLEALGRLLGQSADALRRAGEGLGAASAGADSAEAGGAPAFARVVPGGSSSPAPSLEQADDKWDEVDDLFRGGEGP